MSEEKKQNEMIPSWPNSWPTFSVTDITEHAGSKFLCNFEKTANIHVMSSPKNWISIIINYSSAQKKLVS